MMNVKLKIIALALTLLMGQAVASAANVTISIKYPGGNALVGEKQGNTIKLAPDLRGGRDWFYWNFDATSDAAGQVHFLIDQIGPQGPTHSIDGGKTWSWLTMEKVTRDEDNKVSGFTYTFDKAGQTVRFAVAIPYQLSHLSTFLDKHKDNPLLKQSVLTKSRHGRDVPLLQIGEPGQGKDAFIMTCRHHACESMVSYTLEGLMEELLSDSYSAKAFLSKYVVYIVPMVDIDGVEEGDQGKGRNPHDHNRDYIPDGNLYPETGAIMKLADEKQIHYAMDFHCPALNGEDHYVFYYDGPRFPHTERNVAQLRRWNEEEGPLVLGKTLSFMKAITPNRTPMNSDFFGYRKDVVFAGTLEVPYSSPRIKLTETLVRDYGKSMVKAILHTKFITDPSTDIGMNDCSALDLVRNEFNRQYGKESAVKRMAEDILQFKGLPEYFYAEANLALAKQAMSKNDLEAYDRYRALVLNNPAITTRQRVNIAISNVVGFLRDAGDNDAACREVISKALADDRLGTNEQASIYQMAARHYVSLEKYDLALKAIDSQMELEQSFNRGHVMLEYAAVLDLMGRPDDAMAKRQETIAYLRGRLVRVPQNFSGPIIARDLLYALEQVPSSTNQEKRDVMNILIDHDDTVTVLKDDLRSKLKNLRD